MRLLEAAKAHLNGEKIKYHILGLYKSEMLGFDKHREAICIATDKQIFIYCQKIIGFETESIPLSTVNSLEVSKGFTGYKIRFISTNNTADLIQIRSTQVDSFIKYIKDNTGVNVKKEILSLNNTGGINVADELLKLKQLLDMGALTQAEFDKQKKKLLG